MNRRDLITLLAGATFASAGGLPLHAPALAQMREGHFRIGMLIPFPRTTSAYFVDPFLYELAKLGYIEGRNVILDLVSAEGEIERLPKLAVGLVGRKPEV